MSPLTKIYSRILPLPVKAVVSNFRNYTTLTNPQVRYYFGCVAILFETGREVSIDHKFSMDKISLNAKSFIA